MTTVLSTNITSPLGFTTEQNYRAVRAGRSALRRYDGLWGLSESFAASLFSEEQKAALAIDGYTFFEAIAIHSVREALSRVAFDIASPRVILILSTTKGNIGQSPSDAAQRVSKAIGVTTTPIVVCNACVSGLSAQLIADRLLSAGLYDYAIVVGAEEQSAFIVSGFQSLKAVSDEPCRPFDIERNGLNPGEAAATIIFAPKASHKGRDSERTPEGAWHLVCGAVCNDAYHIISPSPRADGCTLAILATMRDWDRSRLATICVHGTATLYNDQMESIAIQRTGLSDIPLSALKGYYGHTMGAAGVLETILTMCATDDGVVLSPKGFTELGVSGKVSISSQSRPTRGTSFLKLLSGFGGCNVAGLYSKTPPGNTRRPTGKSTPIKVHTVSITPRLASIDGQNLPTTKTGKELLTEIYRKQIGNYPKFYKMDILSRLAFVASELLIKVMGGIAEEPAIILFNHSSSLAQDRQFFPPLRRRRSFPPLSWNHKDISDADNFMDALAPWRADKARIFPSPSVFVYTLPNITTGEIAIRHHYLGETSFYILPEKDVALMQQILEATLNQGGAPAAIIGWVDAETDTTFECTMYDVRWKAPR